MVFPLFSDCNSVEKEGGSVLASYVNGLTVLSIKKIYKPRSVSTVIPALSYKVVQSWSNGRVSSTSNLLGVSMLTP